MSTVIKSVGDALQKQLVEYLKQNDLELSIAVDSSSDISVEDHLNVEIQYVDSDFRVYSFMYRYVPIVTNVGSHWFQ